MKISELIEQLQHEFAVHGDVKVCREGHSDSDGYDDISETLVTSLVKSRSWRGGLRYDSGGDIYILIR